MFRARHTLEEVSAFLETRFDHVTEVVPIGGGEWSQAFSFLDADREFVVRFGAHIEDYRKDEVAHDFAGPDLPIPQVIEIGEAFGAYYAVSDRRYGEPLDHLDGAALEAAFPSILRFLDALRVADISYTQGFGVWGPDGDAPLSSWREFLLGARWSSAHPHRYSGPPAHGWRAVLEGRPDDLAVFEAGYGELATLVPRLPEVRRLLHTDIVGDNVRVRDGEVSAVVDWGNAMYGDFLYDLARLTFWVPWYPAWEHVDIAGAARAHYGSIGLEVPAFEERLRACQIHIGLDAQAYNVFTERWGELARSGQRTLELGEP